MIKYNFFIPGRFPGLNEVINTARSNKYASADQKKEHTVRVYNAIRLTLRDYKKLKKVWITCTWVEKNRRRDPDNIIGGGKKYICDGLELAHMIEKDNWNIVGFTDTWEVGEPGVWVEIKEV